MAKILVVDDSEALRSQLFSDLSQAGHVIVTAVDGVDGLKQLKAILDIQLIICDVNMPNMDGLTMCQNVRQLQNYATVPIFMLTTEANAEMKATAKQIGVRAWISKPYVSSKLANAIATIMNSATSPGKGT